LNSGVKKKIYLDLLDYTGRGTWRNSSSKPDTGKKKLYKKYQYSSEYSRKTLSSEHREMGKLRKISSFEI